VIETTSDGLLSGFMRVGLETVLSTSVSVEDNSDGDFQPVVTARKRKSKLQCQT
jgi:hypothetical protein